MRVPPIARNALGALALGLLTANYVHAATTAAALTPAAGQAITTLNGARVASGVVRGGYVMAQAAVYIAEFGGSVTLMVGSRIAGGAIVAATATAAVAPLVIGGLALGTAAFYAKEWLDAAHAQGKGLDFEYNPATDTIERKAITGNEVNEDQTTTLGGQTITAARAAAGDWLQQACSNGCYGAFVLKDDNCPNMGPTRPAYYLRNNYANVVTSWCLNPSGVVIGGGSPAGKPTVDQWEQLAADLAAIPVNPRILESMGKPLPVDPVPVINPPDQSGSQDVPIGASNPAPTLPSRPYTVTGQAVPVPGTSPQQYTQPAWTITPANDAANPYAVTITSTSTTTGNPATPTNPSVPIPGTATPSMPDVCAQNPDALMCQPPGTITDPNMPPIPVLYERKYPDGLVGVWQQRSQQMAQTPFGQLATQIMPQGLGDGGCPTWEIPLNIGIHDYGTYPLAIPCDYWAVIRVLMIVSSLFLARALIFGG